MTLGLLISAMLKAFFKIDESGHISPTRKIVILLSYLVFLGLIGYADYVTPRDMHLGIAYFLPIWLITWSFGGKAGLIAALTSAILWVVVDNATLPLNSSHFFSYWNASARLIYFSTFTLLIANIREQLHKSAAKIKQLSGLLPICASCKKIRNDEGNWQHIEEYIHAHSEADFTHGICPECAKILYPDLTGKLPEGEKRSDR
jgi:hypothetical protein